MSDMSKKPSIADTYVTWLFAIGAGLFVLGYSVIIGIIVLVVLLAYLFFSSDEE